MTRALARLTPPLPRVEAMVLCDRIWRDPATGKWDLLGVFEWLHTDFPPAKDVAFEVYTAVKGLLGTYEFGLVVLRKGRELARYALGARVHAHDPSRRLQVGFAVTRLTLPALGRYTLRLLVNGEPLHEVLLWVLPEGGEPEGGGAR